MDQEIRSRGLQFDGIKTRCGEESEKEESEYVPFYLCFYLPIIAVYWMLLLLVVLMNRPYSYSIFYEASAHNPFHPY